MQYQEQAARLRLIMEEFEYLKISDFARALDVSQSAMSGYLQGAVFNFEVVLRLAALHKISPNWLVLGLGKMILDEGGSLSLPTIKQAALSLNNQEKRDLAIALLQSEI